MIEVDHYGEAEELLLNPYRNTDGSPHDWQKMLTHALLAVAERLELLIPVEYVEEEEEDDE